MIDYKKDSSQWSQALLLLCWIVIGITLRFSNLADKSPASIEISTLGFSLGHGFSQIPLDQVITLDTLLLPLRFDPTNNWSDVINHLMSETNHPPLYFLLTHFWLKLFSIPGEIVSLLVGRSLSAILGAVAIPAMFGLGWLAFRSPLVAQMAAALMAVSPYGIYVAQEARHYTLTILWIIASLSCLIVAIRRIFHRTSLPIWIGCIWVIVNSLGIATHYFFSLTLLAEGLVMGGFWYRDWQRLRKPQEAIRLTFSRINHHWWRIYAVAAGTIIGCLVWLPVAQGIANDELTDWIHTSFELSEIWTPIPRFLAWWITMVFMLPVEGTSLIVTVISGLVILGVLLWVSPMVIKGLRIQMASPSSRLSILILGGFLIGAIAIFLLIIYGFGKDLSKAARYHFVYFPAIIVLLAASLGSLGWRDTVRGDKKSPRLGSHQLILLMGLFGSITVVSNYGYQKSLRCDLLAIDIQKKSEVPVLVAMNYNSHAEIRALMGLAFDFNRLEDQNKKTSSLTLNTPKFLLIKKHKDDTKATFLSLANILNKQTLPLDLWAVNLKVDSGDLESINCSRDVREIASHGYKTRLYHCLPVNIP